MDFYFCSHRLQLFTKEYGFLFALGPRTYLSLFDGESLTIPISFVIAPTRCCDSAALHRNSTDYFTCTKNISAYTRTFPLQLSSSGDPGPAVREDHVAPHYLVSSAAEFFRLS
jgi:hypothetical protein